MNAEPENLQELSARELEALLAEKRRRRMAKRVKRFLDSEHAIRQVSPQEDDKAVGATVRSPDSWRGARGGDRHFHSLQMEPIIQEGRNLHSEGVTKTPRATPASGQGLLHRIKRGGWSLVLLAIEIAALVSFLVILSNYYGRLQTLNVAVSTATPRQIAIVIATATHIRSATPSPEPTNAPTRS